MNRQKGFRDFFVFADMTIDYVNIYGKFWWTLADFKGTIKRKKVTGNVYFSSSNILNKLKGGGGFTLGKNCMSELVVDHADSRISNFVIEYIRENKPKSLQNCFSLYIWGPGRATT